MGAGGWGRGEEGWGVGGGLGGGGGWGWGELTVRGPLKGLNLGKVENEEEWPEPEESVHSHVAQDTKAVGD